MEKVNAARVYMDNSTNDKLSKSGAEVMMAKSEFASATLPNTQLTAEEVGAKMGAATARAQRALDEFMDILRKELGLTPSSPSALAPTS